MSEIIQYNNAPEVAAAGFHFGDDQRKTLTLAS